MLPDRFSAEPAAGIQMKRRVRHLRHLRTRRMLLIVLLFPVIPLTATWGKHPAPPDVLFTDGIVHTFNPAQPLAEAVAVRGGTITWVGSTAEAEALASPSTNHIDLAGATLLPGLTDAHVHPAMGEFLLRRLCNVQSYTNAEGLQKLRACLAKAPPGDWVVAYGWYMTDNPNLAKVALEDLDAISGTKNLVVIARDHHTAWVNSRTLMTLGITQETQDPAGGSIGRDAVSGTLTGVLRDAAIFPLITMIRSNSPYAADALALNRTAVTWLHSLGITSLVDAMVDADSEAAWRALARNRELTMSVSMAPAVRPDDFRTEIPRVAARRDTASPKLRIDYVKVFADGNLEDGLAFMLDEQGRPDPASRGYYTQAQMDELVTIAEEHGLSVFVHVIGDAAARQVLDAIEKARATQPCPHCRHTLTHLQWVHPDDRPRFAGLGVTANIQEAWTAPRVFGGPPGYSYADAMAASLIGPRIANSMFPWRSLHVAGARLAGGSDWFFTEENPWHTLAMGATSQDIDNLDGPPMLPRQVFDVPTLLSARIAGGAWQMQHEHTRGRVSAGQAADLVIVDRDVMRTTPQALAGTRVLSTWVDGVQVWPPQAQRE